MVRAACFQLSMQCVCVCHRDAVGSMYGVQCPYEVAQQFKSLAVSAFEDPSTWTEARVSDLGNIIGEIIPCVFLCPLQETKLNCITPQKWSSVLTMFLSPSAGLNAPELASLNPSVGPFLCATCIPLIPTGNFAVSNFSLVLFLLSGSGESQILWRGKKYI